VACCEILSNMCRIPNWVRLGSEAGALSTTRQRSVTRTCNLQEDSDNGAVQGIELIFMFTFENTLQVRKKC
jgi:hypothetical protein